MSKHFGPPAPTPSHHMTLFFGIAMGGFLAGSIGVGGLGLGLMSAVMFWWLVVMDE